MEKVPMLNVETKNLIMNFVFVSCFFLVAEAAYAY